MSLTVKMIFMIKIQHVALPMIKKEKKYLEVKDFAVNVHLVQCLV